MATQAVGSARPEKVVDQQQMYRQIDPDLLSKCWQNFTKQWH